MAITNIHLLYFLLFSREALNKSSAAGQRIFCPQSAVWRMGNIAQPLPAKLAYGCGIPLAGTQSIPTFSKPCLRTKSLAPSSCRFNQSFPKQSFSNRVQIHWTRFKSSTGTCKYLRFYYTANYNSCKAFSNFRKNAHLSAHLTLSPWYPSSPIFCSVYKAWTP